MSNSHTYVGGGDYPELPHDTWACWPLIMRPTRPPACYRFKKIYQRRELGHDKLRSPLTEPGVNVQEGDYLIAVNGRALKAPQNPYELFVNTANETVTLTVNSKPSEDGARNVKVKPIGDEVRVARELLDREQSQKGGCRHQRPGGIHLYPRYGRRRD